MNIIFVFRSIANKNGTERTLTDKINYLANMGHNVTLITYEQGCHPYSFSIDENKVNCIDFGCRYFTIYKYSLFKRIIEGWKLKLRFKKKLQAIVDEIHPDVITTPTYTSEYMKVIMSVSKKTRIIVESHTAFTHDMIGGSLFDRIRKRNLLSNIRQSDLLIALTQGDAACWKDFVKNVMVVRNPVTFYPKLLDDTVKAECRIISVGRLHPQKRIDRLIESFSLIAGKHPSWFVDIYGEGDERDILMKKIIGLGLSRQVFLKGVTANVYKEYKRSQLFVLSSDYEGFGLVIVEAMACGLPVVSTDCPFGPSDIIEDGETGLLAEMDVQDLADKMEWMITHETERMEMGRKAHQAAARYKKEIVMKEWEQAYLSVLDKK